MSARLELVLDQLFNSHRLDPDLLTDDAEWVNPEDAVEPGTRRGAEEFNKAVARVFQTWDDVHFEPERLIDEGEDVAVALGTMHGRLHESGMEVTSPHGQVWTFRGGRVARFQWFNAHHQALEAAGSGE
jgi:ketosteroid isomerase-like protein